MICMLHKRWTKWVYVALDYIKSNTCARFPEIGFVLLCPWSYQSPQHVRAWIIYLPASCKPKPVAAAATEPETQALAGRSAHICAVNPGYNLREEQDHGVKVSHSPWGLTPETSCYKGGILPEPSTYKTPPPNDLQPLTFLCGLHKSGSHITLHKISILPSEPQLSGSSQRKSGQYYSFLTMRVSFCWWGPKQTTSPFLSVGGNWILLQISTEPHRRRTKSLQGRIPHEPQLK